MQTGSFTKQVTFSKPFQLAGFDSVEPPGTYTLSLEEDSDALFGWRLITATLQLTHGGTTEYVAIDMQDLRDALLHDTDQSTDPPAAPAPAMAQSRRAPETLQLRARRS